MLLGRLPPGRQPGMLEEETYQTGATVHLPDLPLGGKSGGGDGSNGVGDLEASPAGFADQAQSGLATDDLD